MANLGLAVGLPVALVLLALIIGFAIFAYCRWKKLKKYDVSQPKPGDEERAAEDGASTVENGKTLNKNKPVILLRTPSHSGAEVYVVRHLYQAEDPSQLTLHTGRLVEVLEKQDSGWWRGCIDNTYEGWFPSNFVTKIEGYENEGYVEEDELSRKNREPPKKPETRSPGSAPKHQDESYQDSSILKEDVELGAKAPDSSDYQDVQLKVPDVELEKHVEGFQTQSMTVAVEKKPVEDLHDKASEEQPGDQEEPVYEELGAPASANKPVSPGHFNQSFTDINDDDMKEASERFMQDIMREVNEESREQSRPSEHAEGEISLTNTAGDNCIETADEQNNTNCGKNGEPSANIGSVIEQFKAGHEDQSRLAIEDTDVAIGTAVVVKHVAEDTLDDRDRNTDKPMQSEETQREADVSDVDNIGTSLGDNQIYANLPAAEGMHSEDEEVNGDSNHGDDQSQTVTGSATLNTSGKVITDHKGKSKTLPAKMTLNGDVGWENNTSSSVSGSRKTYVAMYPFHATTGEQLSFNRNDVLLHLEDDDRGFIRGRHRDTGKEGWFPKELVREGKSPGFNKGLMSPEDSNEDLDSDGEFTDDITGVEYKALYSYAGQQEGDLTFSAGESVVVLQMQENGWWRGCSGDKQGWFPASYVEVIVESSSSLPTTPDSGFTSFHLAEPLATSSPAQGGYVSSPELPASPSSQNSSTTNIPVGEDKRAGSGRAKNGRNWKSDITKRFVMPKRVKIPKWKLKKSKSIERQTRPAPPAPPIEVILPSLSPAEVTTSTSENSSRRSSQSSGAGPSTRRRSSTLQRPTVPPPAPPANRSISSDTQEEEKVVEELQTSVSMSPPVTSVTLTDASINSVNESKENIYQNVSIQQSEVSSSSWTEAPEGRGQTQEPSTEDFSLELKQGSNDECEQKMSISGVPGESSTDDAVPSKDTSDSDLLSSILGTLGKRDIHIDLPKTEKETPATGKETLVLKVKPVMQTDSNVTTASEDITSMSFTKFNESGLPPQRPPRSPNKKHHPGYKSPVRPVVAVKPVISKESTKSINAQYTDSKNFDISSSKTSITQVIGSGEVIPTCEVSNTSGTQDLWRSDDPSTTKEENIEPYSPRSKPAEASPKSKPLPPPKPDMEAIRGKHSQSVSDLAVEHNLSFAVSPEITETEERGENTRGSRPKVPPKRPKRPPRRAKSAGAILTYDLAKELGLETEDTETAETADTKTQAPGVNAEEEDSTKKEAPPKPTKRVKRVSSLMEANHPASATHSASIVKHVVSPTTKASPSSDPLQFFTPAKYTRSPPMSPPYLEDSMAQLDITTETNTVSSPEYSPSSVTSPVYSPSSVTSSASPSMNLYTAAAGSKSEDTVSDVNIESTSYESESLVSSSSPQPEPVKPPRTKKRIADFETPRPYRPPAIRMGTRNLSTGLNPSPTGSNGELEGSYAPWPQLPLNAGMPSPKTGSPASSKRSGILTQLSDLRSSQESLNVSDAEDGTSSKYFYTEEAAMDFNLNPEVGMGTYLGYPTDNDNNAEQRVTMETSTTVQQVVMGTSPADQEDNSFNRTVTTDEAYSTWQTSSQEVGTGSSTPPQEKVENGLLTDILGSLPDGPPPPPPTSLPPELDDEDDIQYSVRTYSGSRVSGYEMATIGGVANFGRTGVVTDMGQSPNPPPQ